MQIDLRDNNICLFLADQSFTMIIFLIHIFPLSATRINILLHTLYLRQLRSDSYKNKFTVIHFRAYGDKNLKNPWNQLVIT